MPLFPPRLLNGPFGDAALLLLNDQAKTGLLFDLGDLHALSVKELLKISHVFVSHTHMDHFAGFEQLLRQNLSRPAPLHLYGPQNFIKQVQAKLQGFTWNLIKDPCYTLEIIATEVRPRGLWRQMFRAAQSFAPQNPAQKLPANPILLDTEAFSVSCAILDHGTPCLGFALTEKTRARVNVKALESMGLKPGPWLQALLKTASNGPNAETKLTVLTANGDARVYPLQELQARLIELTPPYKLAYLTDLAFTKSNLNRAVKLAQNADALYLEAAFTQADAAHAKAKNHLTTHEAGILIKACKAKAWQIFHFSHKYQHNEAQVWDEVNAALINDTP